MRLVRLLVCVAGALVLTTSAAAGTTPQTIVVKTHAPATAAYNTAFTVSADSTSGLPVAFSASGSCTNAGGRVSMTSGTGTCIVRYDQAGDATYAAAPTLVESVTAQKADQSIIQFDPIKNATFGDPNFDVAAFTSSGLDVTFSATGSCTVSGVTVHITGAGSCTVTGSQPGDANFNAAPSVSNTLTIAKTGQTIDFEPLVDVAFGHRDFNVRATADSGLRVVFTARGACIVHGSRVHLTRVGTCTITARQPGNANFAAAKNETQSFAVARAGCTVPRLVGKRLNAAKRALVTSRCRVGNVRYAHTSAAKRGRVVAQRKRAGRVLRAGSKVDLVVGRR
jgi:hypothetical protein